MPFRLEYPLISGRIYVTESQIICGSRDGTANVLYPHSSYTHPSTKQCNYTYTHPSTIQCSAATEINNLKSSVSNGKSAIASAITDKGVSTASDATFQTMANNIRSILTGIDSLNIFYYNAGYTSSAAYPSRSCNLIIIYNGEAIEYGYWESSTQKYTISEYTGPYKGSGSDRYRKYCLQTIGRFQGRESRNKYYSSYNDAHYGIIGFD